MTLPYNLLMLAVDALAIWLIGRTRKLIVWCVVMGCAAAIAIGLGFFLGNRYENHFGVYRLWCFGLFYHASLLLIASAFNWRKSRPRLALAALLAIVALIVVAANAFWIEPYRLEVSHWQVASPKLRRPLRVLILADLQANRLGPFEVSVLQRVKAEKPDLLLLAGDYLQTSPDRMPALRQDFHRLLKKLQLSAPRGVFAIRGNVDPNDWRDVFQGLDIVTVNTTRSFSLGDNVRLTCLGLQDSFNTALKLDNPQPEEFHLVLGHAPNFALGQVEADLRAAGHTHGGQVRMPWIGPITTHARTPHAWSSGLTDLPGGGKLSVSRGIGMERGYAPPIRFFCRPELVILDLSPPTNITPPK
ncbi:MAG: metallophosphoesterase [Planctomycetaceae bacterium]|nr:metallophosphoesterase [Planctomycetaceae bacterium]